jgi:hypothetical protein
MIHFSSKALVCGEVFQVRKFELVSLVAAILLAKRERINVSQQDMEVAVDEAIQIIALTEKKLGYTTGQR